MILAIVTNNVTKALAQTTGRFELRRRAMRVRARGCPSESAHRNSASTVGSVTQLVCESRLSLVRLDAAGEMSGRWLDAAHAYAYLIHYSGIPNVAAVRQSYAGMRG